MARKSVDEILERMEAAARAASSCPWCGAFIDEIWLYFEHGNDAEFDCPECERPILGSRTVDYSLEPDRQEVS